MATHTVTISVYDYAQGSDEPSYRIRTTSPYGLQVMSKRVSDKDTDLLNCVTHDYSVPLGALVYRLPELEKHDCIRECVYPSGHTRAGQRDSVCHITNLFTFIDELQDEVNFLVCELTQLWQAGEEPSELTVSFEVEADF